MTKDLVRCWWPGDDPLYCEYHDKEWGRPITDSQLLFELLNLEGAQAGLSWITILRKRENYRRAFDGFDPEIVSQYGHEKVADLLSDPGIVRNKLKVSATIGNARAYLELRESGLDFAYYLWDLAGGSPQVNRFESSSDVPASTRVSDAMSRELKRRGFKFVGSTICYAFMQSAGMVNDHLVQCFCWRECRNLANRFSLT